jgi:hypothetical protein
MDAIDYWSQAAAVRDEDEGEQIGGDAVVQVADDRRRG